MAYFATQRAFAVLLTGGVTRPAALSAEVHWPALRTEMERAHNDVDPGE